MHSFWTLVRADFVVEILSKILFTGRFPRAVALLIAFFIGSFLIGWWCILRVYDLVSWIILREGVRAQICFRKIRKIVRLFGDTVEVLGLENGYRSIQISSTSFRYEVQMVEIRIYQNTERASFILHFSDRSQELPYEFFRNHCGAYERYDLHRLSIPYLFSRLRGNCL